MIGALSMQNRKTNKKKSSHFNEKIWIRQEALKNVEKANVLDCFHGQGKLWERLCSTENNIKTVTGIEIKKMESKFSVIRSDNMEVLKSSVLEKYNVFDLDSYGYPVKQMDILFKRLKTKAVIIYTMCYSSLAAIPQEINIAQNITKKCKTIMPRYTHDMYEYYLYKHGIQEYYEYSFNERVKKCYGYFLYHPEKDLTRTDI